ncbi:hypothetical protein ACN26P_003477 [Vibrio cholerae]|nr:hypothetical protein [Vibrio cholerae]
MKIDTNYKSLAEVDENIRRYYEEENRERVTGYSEPNEEGVSTPIVEPYTVVVLNQPDEVTYDDVLLRKSERKSWEEVVKPELERAFAWEEFKVNHNQYLDWLDALASWEKEQPTEMVWDEDSGGFVEQVAAAPTRPTVDTEKQAKFEEELIASIAGYHAEIAIHSRKAATLRDIEYQGHLFQMGGGKDGLLGIDNFNRRIAAIAADPSKEQEVIYWITKSNEAVPITYEDVRNIVNVFYDREQAIFAAYTQWRNGDKLSEFNPV